MTTSSTVTTARGERAGGKGESGPLFSATRLGNRVGLSPCDVNRILCRLGWIERHENGWVPTALGFRQGGVCRRGRETGKPYVVWPEGVLGVLGVLRSASAALADPRSRYPARYRATDGHHVRSRAELVIDNWLYARGLAHAYERQLPVGEGVYYCDFHLREADVYIEYWGRDEDPRYRERKMEKQVLYERLGLALVDLPRDAIERLDDHLPRLLRRFGVRCG